MAFAALVPVAAGLGGALLGARFLTHAPAGAALDSHFRYLSGLLLAIGAAFWTMVPRIEASGRPFRLLTLLVVTGGLARALGAVLMGPPPAPMLFGLCMELLVTPALCAWQWRVEKSYSQAGARRAKNA
ncbi:MAG TPA: DUF4345 domain-containing protein [Beijerinckiaceae bacterium]|nr:DUF4345 domain-containing protein [Beijerinckiaceae bacterium]